MELNELSDQRLREEFWAQDRRIRKSREAKIEDENANKEYGDARQILTAVATELSKRYDEDILYMEDEEGNYRAWHTYL